MITNYFDIYRKKIDILNLEQLIADKELKMREYDEFLSSSAGSSLLINRLMSRNYIMTERAKEQDEEEKLKIEKEHSIEFLALDDMKKNLCISFEKSVKKELAKYLQLFDKKNNLDLIKNVDYLTKSSIKQDDTSFAYNFSQVINELYNTIDIDGNPASIQLSKFMDAKSVKKLFKRVMNGLYNESLNMVSVDYVRGDNSNSDKGSTVNINSVPAGI